MPKIYAPGGLTLYTYLVDNYKIIKIVSLCKSILHN